MENHNLFTRNSLWEPKYFQKRRSCIKFPTLDMQMVSHVYFDILGKYNEVQSKVYTCMKATSAMYIDLIRTRHAWFWSSLLTGVN